ncbi:phage portal protein [Liquorilactobacillus sucicola DSM 21376 = JCM 15457]|uniref:Phage portal protein n=1 Tax=Liquorilactobacillus sucicola DSM 21376 = JCM 15457 TaxID=1423806 RepID=A0A023D0F1_9LACO
MSFFYDSTDIEPDKDTAFIDAVVSMSNTDSVFVGAQALRNADVWAAIRIIASDIASNRIKCEDQKIETLINDKPNDIMNGYQFKFVLACQMLLSGNSFAEIKNDQLNFLKNSCVTVTQDDLTGQVKYYHQPSGGTKRQIAPNSILHFKIFTQDGVTGISPLYSLQDELIMQKKGNNLLKGFFDSPQRNVLTVHKSDLSTDAKQSIRQKFEQANQGALSSVILDDSMTLSQLQIDTGILKVINQNNFSTQKVASAFGLPQSMLNVEEVHSNQEQTSSQYYQSTIYKYFASIEAELSFKFEKQFKFESSNLTINKQQEINNILNFVDKEILDPKDAKEKLNL